MSLTTDPREARESGLRVDGQQEKYLILSEDERSKGFVRPFRATYTHKTCGGVTTMATPIAETYARDPKFYGGTFCIRCRKHFALVCDGVYAFAWGDGSGVGE